MYCLSVNFFFALSQGYMFCTDYKLLYSTLACNDSEFVCWGHFSRKCLIVSSVQFTVFFNALISSFIICKPLNSGQVLEKYIKLSTLSKFLSLHSTSITYMIPADPSSALTRTISWRGEDENTDRPGQLNIQYRQGQDN